MAAAQATVFGGSGFLGRYMVQRLAEAGTRVLVGVRRPELAGFLRTMGDVGQVVPIRVDLRDGAAVAAALEGSDVAINAVGILYERGQQRFDAIHAQAAERVAKAAAVAAVERLIHVSALGGDLVSRYGRSKAAGEAAVRAAFPDATILRPSLVFGPEDDFFNRFAAMARIAPVLPLIDGGHTRFQPVHVEDVAAAAMRALDDDSTAGRVYELGGPRVYSFRELLEYIVAETDRRCLLLPVPAALMTIKAWFLEFWPTPLLTRDQVLQLASDSVVGDGTDVGRLADLGITPTALEVVAPSYLARYRRGGGLAPSRGA
jgi:NADH dehydrogenase